MRSRMLLTLAGFVGFASVSAAVMLALAVLTTPSAVAQKGDGAAESMYDLEYETPVAKTVSEDGKNVTYVTVRFTVKRKGQDVELDAAEYKIFIFEQGAKVAEKDIPRVRVSRDLSVILGVDTSGSMNEFGKMAKAKTATKVFFATIPPDAEAGLILFDHEMRQTLPLGKDRSPLIAAIEAISPRGGTAYRDACMEGVKMLAGVQGRERAIVVLTDGVDLNSEAGLQDVIAKAKKAKVRIYPVGIGEPGKETKVTSMLVLDKSGSMNSPANNTDKLSKLKALQVAARRFVKIIPESDKNLVRSSIVEFSDFVTMPSHFTSDKQALYTTIDALEGKGETAVFDAAYAALMSLVAENPEGKRAVVVLTDGIDNRSRHRVEEVVALAKEAKIPLYVLGFGKKGELDEQAMYKMANETGGEYYLASNQKDLLLIFEKLSIQIHDDGINEAELTKLANGTGGKYYPAKDIKQLEMILQTVSKGIVRKEFKIRFKSRFQRDDGLARDVEIQLVRRRADGTYDVVGGGKMHVQSRGLVLAQMSPVVYLGFLMIFGLLIGLPAAFNWLTKSKLRTG